MKYWAYKIVKRISDVLIVDKSRGLSNKQKANLEYAQQFPPYLQTMCIYGRIDFLNQVEPKKLVIRGWLFHVSDTIKQLSVELDDLTIPVYGIRLARNDVKAIYPQYSTSAHSGFVAVLPLEIEKVYHPFSLLFKVLTTKNELISAYVLML